MSAELERRSTYLPSHRQQCRELQALEWQRDRALERLDGYEAVMDRATYIQVRTHVTLMAAAALAPTGIQEYDAGEQGLDQDRDTRSHKYDLARLQQERSKQGRQHLVQALQEDPEAAASGAVALEALKRRPPLANSRGAGRGSPIPTRSAATAFIYLRVSTSKQAKKGGRDEGYSIPTQRMACREKASQLSAEIVAEYVDAGESAKTAHRTELQQLLKAVAKQKPDYLIVHKIDRLARNREDDMAIRLILKRAGTQLISCSEQVTDSPSGRFLYNIMADMAQFYSDNLAVEVMKGLVAKAREGGTPFRAPLGYLNKKDFANGSEISYVVIDPERGPIIRWCFESYATGEWTVSDLTLAARQKGLTNKPTRVPGDIHERGQNNQNRPKCLFERWFE